MRAHYLLKALAWFFAVALLGLWKMTVMGHSGATVAMSWFQLACWVGVGVNLFRAVRTPRQSS